MTPSTNRATARAGTHPKEKINIESHVISGRRIAKGNVIVGGTGNDMHTRVSLLWIRSSKNPKTMIGVRAGKIASRASAFAFSPR
jgi:hypothetical protein